jgi:hypothetical protein
LTTILDSLARRFRGEQVNIVKATSTGNNLIGSIFDESERHLAVLLYVPLETYLATMLGKGKQGGDLWGQAPTRMKDWLGIEAEPNFALHQLRAPQFAVLSWLTSMNYMLEATEAYGQRLMLLDFEDLIIDPDPHLRRVSSFFGLENEADSIVERFPEISSSYSKLPDRRYTPELRAQLLQRTRNQYAADIKTGLDWAESLIERVQSLKPLAAFMG